MTHIKDEMRAALGRLGAAALNARPEAKRAACLKAAKTRMEKEPGVFSRIGAIGGRISKRRKPEENKIHIFRGYEYENK